MIVKLSIETKVNSMNLHCRSKVTFVTKQGYIMFIVDKCVPTLQQSVIIMLFANSTIMSAQCSFDDVRLVQKLYELSVTMFPL